MKIYFCLIATALFAAPVLAQDVGVSVSIGDPGFYGRIDIGDAPRPRILYREPIVIEQVQVVAEPLYLRVPAGHARHWKQHCREYDACDRSVYFVRDDWYNNVYAPDYRERHGHHEHDDGDDHQDEGRGEHGHGHGRGHKD